MLAAAACADGAQGGAAKRGRTADARPPLVRTEAVELRRVRQIIDTTSYLVSEYDISVLPRISGRVVEVAVDEGERVEPNQLLARLDDEEARTSLRQVEVQLQDRKVRHELAKLESEAAKLRIKQAEIAREQASLEYARNTKIDPGLISEKELEDSKFALDTATEAVQVATLNSRKADLEVDAAAQAIENLEAQVEAARIRLRNHEVRTPEDSDTSREHIWVVAERMVKGGENVSAANSLNSVIPAMFRIIDAGNLIAYLSRPQRERQQIRNAREVRFTTDAWGDREFHATIDVVSPVIDETTGSFRIRVRVAKDQVADLSPGMFVRAKIMTEDERDALMVPKAAVVNDGARAVVFAIRDNIAHRIVLETGLEERDHIECRNLGDGGLAPGDQVVVSGQQELRDRTTVEVSREG
jgi:RND family efflux transporter MFP subunit